MSHSSEAQSPESVDPKDSPSPYRVATRTVRALLDCGAESEKAVELHLAMLSESHLGRETISEALNRQRAFVPVKDVGEGGSHFLVRRSSIRTVTVQDATSPDENHSPSEHEPSDDPERLRELKRGGLGFVDVVTLELTGGGTVEGTLVTVLPPSSSRLSDYFNANEATFFPVFVEEDVVYVNKEWIAAVRW